RERPGPHALGRTPLDLARACAAHLLASRMSYRGLPRAWAMSPRKPPLGDFCYGAAGISYALQRLHEATGDRELGDAASEGWAFVRGLYSPEHGNWRDIRATLQLRARIGEGSTWRDFWFSDWSDGPAAELATGAEEPLGPLVDAFGNSWCHGGAGIVLARLAALHLVDTPEVREELSGALPRVAAFAQPEQLARGGEDDLCCGHMGRADVLLQARLVTGDAAWGAAAMSIAQQVWLQALARGRYNPSAARGSATFAPTLFQGVSGVGYGFLRLAFPEVLPSVLLLE
ncbi:lanthionine synthetase LanC family protein, partial [Pyxidicoccus sp. 3LG]